MNLKPCPFCGGEAKVRAVGNQKEYLTFFCSVCGRTPVDYCEASTTVWGAKKVWNRRADNGRTN